jgi:hypothetical protein
MTEFLLDVDAFGPLKNAVHDLECTINVLSSSVRILLSVPQLSAICQNKEDPYFRYLWY